MSQPRAYMRVIYTGGTPAASVRRGFAAVADDGDGLSSATLGRPIDITEGCVLCSFAHAGQGTVPQESGTIAADITGPDTAVSVAIWNSGGTLADPATGTGYCTAVFDPTG